MRRTLSPVALLAAASLIAACNPDDLAIIDQVSIRDQCDSTSFNAALGEGACVKAGSVTFDAFNAELNATGRVSAWEFVPTDLQVMLGNSVFGTNDGGEIHTFTEVETFGGGIVDVLNELSGNPTPAPECLNLPTTAFISPGATFSTEPETSVGTEHYQCCIHPWMRANVTVIR